MRLLAALRSGGLLACCALGLHLTGCDGSDHGSAAGLVRVFGRTGLGELEFAYPRAVATTPDRQRFYVVDKAGRIQGITPEGQFICAWRMPEIDAGKPTGLGIDAAGRIYAADTHYGRVALFAADGTPLTTFGKFGTAAGEFRLPTDVAIDADGYIYVSEYGGNDRISKFTPQFEYVMSFADRASGEGATNRPQSLCFAGDVLLVADACNHRICRYSRMGQFLGAFGRLGNQAGELRFPFSVDVLPDDTIVVAEYGNNRVQRFSAAGEPLGMWGRAGRDPGELAYPWAAAVLPEGRVAVLDSGNNRVQIFEGLTAGSWLR